MSEERTERNQHMKIRIRFSKDGSMKFIGHLDVMRYFQKCFRRAKIPVKLSEGFSPHFIMSFASPLGIGLTTCGDYLDVTLKDDTDPIYIKKKLNSILNDEMRVLSVTLLPDDEKTSMSMLAACDYSVTVKSERASGFHGPKGESLRKKLIDFMSQKNITVLKKTKKSEKEVNIRDNIYAMSSSADEFDDVCCTHYNLSDIQALTSSREDINNRDEYENGINSKNSGNIEKSSNDDHCRTAPDVKRSYGDIVYMRVTSGSVTNIKPELVLESFAVFCGYDYDMLDYQIKRLDMFADKNAVKGKVNTMNTDPPCELVSLSEYV